MGTLRVLGSSSQGNCYILENEGQELILELGVNWKLVKKALNYDLGLVVGALVSHSHGDHSKYINNALKDGVLVYSNKDVSDKNKGVHILELNKKVMIGGFEIQPFSLTHDVECYGYLISASEIGRVLFITDTSSVNYKFRNINNYLIESNYSDSILERKFLDGTMSIHTKIRGASEHLSLEKAIKFINNQENIRIRNIILLHLSDENSDAREFVERARNETGIGTVFVADKEKVFNLKKYF